MMKSSKLPFFLFLMFVTHISMNSCSQKDDNEDNPVDTTVYYAQLPDATIAYKIYGSGEPLVMCIGYATNMDMWATKVLDELSKKFKVIIFDYRGMGYSTSSDTSLTISGMADDVNGLLDALNISEANVLGWSMGGFVAQMFAINYPEKVKRLVLYATNCGDTLTVNPSQEILDILSNPDSTPEEFLSTLFADDFLANHPEPWTLLPEGKEPVNGEAIGMQYMAVQQWLSPGGGSAGHLDKLKMPVLLICGNEDKVVPFVNSDILADSISTSSLVRVNDNGHGMMYQSPELFAAYLLSFLDK
jgi:pimeloyl-ACP methyl ester carboxylesterase